MLQMPPQCVHAARREAKGFVAARRCVMCLNPGKNHACVIISCVVRKRSRRTQTTTIPHQHNANGLPDQIVLDAAFLELPRLFRRQPARAFLCASLRRGGRRRAGAATAASRGGAAAVAAAEIPRATCSRPAAAAAGAAAPLLLLLLLLALTRALLCCPLLLLASVRRRPKLIAAAGLLPRFGRRQRGNALSVAARRRRSAAAERLAAAPLVATAPAAGTVGTSRVRDPAVSARAVRVRRFAAAHR